MPYQAKDATVTFNGTTIPVQSWQIANEEIEDEASEFFKRPPQMSISFEPTERIGIDPAFFNATYSFTILLPETPRKTPRKRPHPHNRRWRRRQAYIAARWLPPRSVRFDGMRLKEASPDGTCLEFVTVPATVMTRDA